MSLALPAPAAVVDPVVQQLDEVKIWAVRSYPPRPDIQAADLLQRLASLLNLELPRPGEGESRGPRVWSQARDGHRYKQIISLKDGDPFVIYREAVPEVGPDGQERILEMGEAMRCKGGTI